MNETDLARFFEEDAVDSTFWGRTSSAGRCHAMTLDWWHSLKHGIDAVDRRWVLQCNPHNSSRTELQLTELDIEPGDNVCTNHACQRAHARHQRVHARRDAADLARLEAHA